MSLIHIKVIHFVSQNLRVKFSVPSEQLGCRDAFKRTEKPLQIDEFESFLISTVSASLEKIPDLNHLGPVFLLCIQGFVASQVFHFREDCGAFCIGNHLLHWLNPRSCFNLLVQFLLDVLVGCFIKEMWGLRPRFENACFPVFKLLLCVFVHLHSWGGSAKGVEGCLGPRMLNWSLGSKFPFRWIPSPASELVFIEFRVDRSVNRFILLCLSSCNVGRSSINLRHPRHLLHRLFLLCLNQLLSLNFMLSLVLQKLVYIPDFSRPFVRLECAFTFFLPQFLKELFLSSFVSLAYEVFLPLVEGRRGLA